MEQVKVYFNSEIKRTTLAETYLEFESTVKAMFKIESEFGLYMIQNTQEKSLLNEENYQELKSIVLLSKSVVKVVVGDAPPKVIEYSFNNEINKEEEVKTNPFLKKMGDTINNGLTYARNYYQSSKLPEYTESAKQKSISIFEKVKEKIEEGRSKVPVYYENAKTSTETFFNNIGDKFRRAFVCATDQENDLSPQQKLLLIRNQYEIDRSDQQILAALEQSKGDIDAALVLLF